MFKQKVVIFEVFLIYLLNVSFYFKKGDFVWISLLQNCLSLFYKTVNVYLYTCYNLKLRKNISKPLNIKMQKLQIHNYL